MFRLFFGFLYAGAGSVEVYQLALFADILVPVGKCCALLRFGFVDDAAAL